MAAASVLVRCGRLFGEKLCINRGVNLVRNGQFPGQRLCVRSKSQKVDDLGVRNIKGIIARRLIFTAVATTGTFAGCAILRYEKLRANYMHHGQIPKRSGIRERLSRLWQRIPDDYKIAAVIIPINTVVFLLWRVPACHNFLTRWFVCHPFSHPITLLTSCFSHHDVWHLAINMFVLYSFSPAIKALLVDEQFLALYLSGGMFASFASQTFSLMAKQTLRGSVGASGALLSVISLVCMHFPNMQVFLLFIPLSAGMGLATIVGLDIVGLVMKWTLFDHAAHLGGVLFGAFYLKFGSVFHPWYIRWWARLRENNKSSPP